MAIQPVLSGILRSYGYTKQSMIITLIANVLNVFGNAIFIYGLFGVAKIGPIGVAISTVFSRLVTILLIALVIFKRFILTFQKISLSDYPFKKYKTS